jgi:hypothetical protein
MEEMSPTSKFSYSIKIIESEPDNIPQFGNKSRTSTFLTQKNFNDSFENLHLKAKSKFCDNKSSETKLSITEYSKNLKQSVSSGQCLNKNLCVNCNKLTPETKIKKEPKTAGIPKNNFYYERNQFDFLKDKEQAELLIKEGIQKEKDFDELFKIPIIQKVFNLKEE